MSEPKKPENDQQKTVINIMTEYLKMRQGHKKQKKKKIHAEMWLLRQLRIYVEKKETNIKATEMTAEVYERFLKWLSDSFECSTETLKSYRSRLKGFQRYIELCTGIPQVKVKKNNPKNPQLVILGLQQQLVKKDDQFAKKDEESNLRWETIEEKDAEIAKKDDTIKELKQKSKEEKEKECSQCQKIAPFKAKIDELQRVQYMIDSGEFEKVQQLLGEKTQIEEQVTENEKIIKNQRFIRLACPLKGGSRVLVGNDCEHCSQRELCGSYGEATRA